MKRLFLFLGIITTLVSCSVDNVDYDVNNAHSNKLSTSNQYSISEEEALANLYAFMGQGGNSRSSDSRVVQTILPVKYSQLGSRAVEGIDCDNLLYVANFENEEGYAILAGDTRIEDEVIAIIDEGTLEPNVLNNFIIEWEPNERTYYDEFPMTGPGFFTTPETGDEVFMNPNTVNLYDEEVQDTLVGNFVYETDTIGSRSLSNEIEPNNGLSENIMLPLCATYAVRSVIFNPNPRDDGEEGGGGDGDGDNNGGDVTETVTISSGWQVTSQVAPLLHEMRGWWQGAPFNSLYKTVTHFPLFWKTKQASAGCFPLAIAKIITHFEYPANRRFNNTIIDFDALKEDRYSEDGRNAASNLLKGISDECDCLYFYSGTFTFPCKAENFLSDIGYSNVERYNYGFDRSKDMLDEGKPIIIMSIPNINLKKSHAWNIDGYKIYERTTTTEVYINNTLHSSTTYTETQKLVHCNFGWSTEASGYYASGVFDLGNPNANVEPDPGSETDRDTNFNNFLKIITYNL